MVHYGFPFRPVVARPALASHRAAPGTTAGKLPSPSERHRRETLAPPRIPVLSSWTYRPELSRRGGAGAADPAGRRERRGTFMGQ